MLAHTPAPPPTDVPFVMSGAVVEECEVVRLVAVIDPKTKEKKKAKVGGRAGGPAVQCGGWVVDGLLCAAP